MPTDAARMMALFAGYDQAHGTHGRGVANAAKGGKLEIRTTARTLREPVTEELWAKHLDGSMPLGTFAVRADQSVMWGAIDVDDYTITHSDLVQRIRREGWPMHVCKTKSGGAHCYLFLSVSVPAEKMITKLRDMAGVLGVSGSEIFPKQAQVLWDSGDFGSWLNMPYLGSDKTDRYAVNEKGKGLTLRQFLDAAEAGRINDAEFEDLGAKEKADPQFGDGPPCLQTLTAKKLEQGEQNSGLIALAVLAKKKYPDKWVLKLQEWAWAYCDPPVPPTDDGLKTIINNATKKQYNYQCKTQPIAGVCNAALCRTRRHGVGGGGNMPKMANLAVLNTDEPVWFLDVEGIRCKMSTTDLLNYAAFQQRVMEATQVLPPVIKRETWVGVLQGLLKEVQVIDAPDDVGREGQFREILDAFLTDRQRAETRDEINMGKPYWDDDGLVWFRLQDLAASCQRAKFAFYTRTQMIAILRGDGAEEHTLDIKKKRVRVLSLPASNFSVQSEAYDTPDIQERVI